MHDSVAVEKAQGLELVEEAETTKQHPKEGMGVSGKYMTIAEHLRSFGVVRSNTDDLYTVRAEKPQSVYSEQHVLFKGLRMA